MTFNWRSALCLTFSTKKRTWVLYDICCSQSDWFIGVENQWKFDCKWTLLTRVLHQNFKWWSCHHHMSVSYSAFHCEISKILQAENGMIFNFSVPLHPKISVKNALRNEWQHNVMAMPNCGFLIQEWQICLSFGHFTFPHFTKVTFLQVWPMFNLTMKNCNAAMKNDKRWLIVIFDVLNSQLETQDMTKLHCTVSMKTDFDGQSWVNVMQFFDAPKSSTDKCQLAGTSDEAQNGNQMIFLIHINFQRWQNQQWWQGLNIFAWSMHISSLCNRLCICWLQNNAQWNDFTMQRIFCVRVDINQFSPFICSKCCIKCDTMPETHQSFSFRDLTLTIKSLKCCVFQFAFFLSVNVYYFACFMICLQFLKCFIAVWHSQERMAFWHTFWINPQQQTKTRARRM